MSNPIVGIDLGTTHSAIGIVDSGFAILLADEQGRRIIPSVVPYGEDGFSIASVKRVIGRRLDEALLAGHTLVAHEGQLAIETPIGPQTPEQVSAEILRALKATAEQRLGHEVTRAVITVPAYFNDAQRAATVRAGELAGFTVERLLSEPTAAALHYGLDQLPDDSLVAVYDLGGGTFDISILKLIDGVYEVLSTCGDTALGGDDVDLALLAHLGANATTKNLAAAREIKHQLTAADAFHSPHFDRAVTREELGTLARSLLDRTASLCRRAMADAGVKAEQIDEVILVGGSTRMPAVGEIVTQVFDRAPNLTQHPDEAIALGAAVQAGILSGSVKKVVLIDVTPLSLGIETYGGLMNVLIPRNTTIPCKAGEVFTNASAEQTGMRIRILQGEREMARDNWELGSFDLEFGAAAKGQIRIGVQFALDENGILQVLARDLATNTDTIVEIESAAVDVDDAAVGKMVEESVDFAFDDMGERIFTEARLKAEELLPAVDTALSQVGDKISDAERQEIEAASQEVKFLLAEGTDHNALKAAVKVLDQATESLAAIILEAAFDSM